MWLSVTYRKFLGFTSCISCAYPNDAVISMATNKIYFLIYQIVYITANLMILPISEKPTVNVSCQKVLCLKIRYAKTYLPGSWPMTDGFIANSFHAVFEGT